RRAEPRDCAIVLAPIERILVPVLRHGAALIMDNLAGNKGAAARDGVEAAGAERRSLPPESPDLTPVENAFSTLRALLRKAACRTRDALSGAVGVALDVFTPGDCRNDFTAAGYKPE
ncbi:MAG: transposase, partial [Pseudomonadota bacterium]